MVLITLHTMCRHSHGRIAPQQTHFDPTTSKAVRFVTRNAVPAKATPGSRVERNLRQMYAMMLVKLGLMLPFPLHVSRC